MDTAKTSSFNVALKWAMFYVIVSIVLTYVWQFLNIDQTSSIKYVGYIPFIAFLLLAQKEFRDSLGGFISFGQAFVAGLLYSIIGAVVISIFIYIYFAFLSPGVFEKIMDTQKDAMTQKGMSSDQIDQAMEILKKYGALITAFFSIFAIAIFGIIVALVGAAIFKKERTIQDIEQNSDSFTDPAV
ncbi:DUF4199 domain-containing protein [Mucilaginibacter sp.]|uniref:DUF4199 domain-containing protein n=1 Tax=Mucilaginibacter sp. TaxID=1882438 RepID=UPI00283F06B6|nr:DUF4199 domain-containing protein [Mucilaginibacter sp.]MDR3693863.1 DUF4199 domain-containing protein [Mucilaginibacter sp.]